MYSDVLTYMAQVFDQVPTYKQMPLSLPKICYHLMTSFENLVLCISLMHLAADFISAYLLPFIYLVSIGSATVKILTK